MLDIGHFIDEVRPIKVSLENDSNKFMHVVLCFDDDYAFPAGVNITSIIHNNQNGIFHFHLFVNNLSQTAIAKLEQIELKSSSMTLYFVNQQFQVSKKNTSSFPISACTRLIAPLFLQDISELLYLDSDTLCVGDLYSLKNLDISNSILAAVADVEKMQVARCDQFGLSQGNYFNSGVMYINTHMWQTHNVTEKSLDYLNSTTHYKFPDQDVLNLIIKETKLLLDKKYNRITQLSVEGNEDNAWLNHSVMIHYISGHKPWYRLFLTPTYQKYIALSPWNTQKLLLANENAPSTTRRYAKLLLSRHRFIEAARFYLLYLKHKMLNKK